MSEESFNQSQESFFVQNQMAVPKATQGIFELPCGYLSPEGELVTEVKVREITGIEEDMLAAKNIPSGKKITQLITNCLERLGTITDKTELANCVRSLMIGDRVFLMLAIRRVTLGDDFPFEAKCNECDKKNLFSINLAELEVKTTVNRNKRVFDVVLPSGKPARWHVMTGKEEESLSKFQNLDQLSLSILVRVDLLEGQPTDMDTIKSLNMKDRNFLRDECFNVEEGGIETEMDLQCPACGEGFKTELDVGQTGFFFPSRVQKNSKRSTSSFLKPGKGTPTPNS
jgi:hypothetical protein